MRNLSFRAKILISFVIILSCALIVPSMYFRHELVTNIRQDAVETAKKQLRAVSWVLESEKVPFTLPTLNKRLREIKNNFQLRITYVDKNGKVVADSDVAPEKMTTLENHASRPEIAQALAGPLGVSIRFSATMGKHLIYLAQPESIAGMGSGTLRISMPYSRVQSFLDIMTKNFLGIIALTLLIFTFLTTVFANQLAKSVEHLVAIAISIGEGDYAKRIRVSPGKEFTPLLKAVNHMAEKIEHNIRTITSQKLEMEAILNGMNEGVMALDNAGNILEWNHSMEVIFPAILHKRGHRPIEAIRIPELESTCHQMIQNQDQQPGPVNLQLRTTNDKYYDVNVVPTGKDEPRLIVVFHDITEIKRLETVRKDFVAN
ncbi:MAG: HAMP domain-containing protein, partial [Desulfoplanes sp.]|nr:HAMP domain-containing protein [Desulfoplanes sp.]